MKVFASFSLALIATLASTAVSARPSFEEKLNSIGNSAYHEATTVVSGIPVLNYEMGSPVAPDESWFVKMRAQTSFTEMQSLCESSDSTGGCSWIGNPDSGGIPALQFHGDLLALRGFLELAGVAAVYAEPDGKIQSTWWPNDPEECWPEDAPTWGLKRIGLEKRGVFSGSGVTVYIGDTGVRVTHKEFETESKQSRAAPALDLSSVPAQECNGDVECARDRNGHGTHSAAIAAGRNFGVAPKANVRAVKLVMDDGIGSTGMLVAALDWIAQNRDRPAVSSISVAYRSRRQHVVDAVDNAVANDVTVVVAAGNEKADACGLEPARVASAITVGAAWLNRDWRTKKFFLQKADSSNYGLCVNMWAPSSAVSAYVHGNEDNVCTELSGTSTACPHVSGAAALLLESNPNLTPADVLAELTQMSENDIAGLGKDDVNVMLNISDSWPVPSPPTPRPSPQPTPAPQLGTWEVTGRGCRFGRKNETRDCVYSIGYYKEPKGVRSWSWCLVTIYGEIPLETMDFAITDYGNDGGSEGSYARAFVKMGGKTYRPDSAGPPQGTYTGTIEWWSGGSDYYLLQPERGWRICRAE